MVTVADTFKELITDNRKFIEGLFMVESKGRQVLPFRYNHIQNDVDQTETGMDIWVKPAQVGFSTERIAKRLADTLTKPGTNTVLVAYEDFITERLLSKVQFFYNHLNSLGIPNLPEIHHDSTYEKTFKFKLKNPVTGKLETHSTSSIYIASARSYVAGRAETIHHLLFDEHAFYPPKAMENILSPAMDRVPDDGTVDIYSTPNGEGNDFHDMYTLAKEGKSVFTAHFYPWFLHKEYVIKLGDPRIARYIPETGKPEFRLDRKEQNLVDNFNLTFDQIRWRRWKVRQKESLRRSGEMVLLFQQEFPEDDVSCFLATGDMRFDKFMVDKLADGCHPAGAHLDSFDVWYWPEPGVKYGVTIDPGQAKVTQSAITVGCFVQDEHGNYHPKLCARDAGLYSPAVTWDKAVKIAKHYNNAMIAWEANSHGLAITELGKHHRPIYMRTDIVSGAQSIEPGWLTTSKNKDYMLQAVDRYLPDTVCHDIELVRQIRNHRLVGDKVDVVGANDIFMSWAVFLMTFDPKPKKYGYSGRHGYKW